MSLIFDFEKFQDMHNSPIRLFLYALEEYGYDINISRVNRRLFFNEKGKIMSNKLKEWRPEGKAESFGIFAGSYKNTHFFYSINVENYLDDLRKNKI